jgi:S-adenosylmethionine decarboxylase
MKKTLFLSGLVAVFVPFAFCEQLQQELILDENISSQDEVHLPTGRHVIADLWGCENCDYTPEIEEVLREAAEKAGATVLNIYIHKFDPSGMTATVALSESHITFHTWPDDGGFVACDIFTCGTNALPEKGLDVLLNFFKPKISNVRILGRGQAAESNAPKCVKE